MNPILIIPIIFGAVAIIYPVVKLITKADEKAIEDSLEEERKHWRSRPL